MALLFKTKQILTYFVMINENNTVILKPESVYSVLRAVGYILMASQNLPSVNSFWGKTKYRAEKAKTKEFRDLTSCC
jgi:hypothetical protein